MSSLSFQPSKSRSLWDWLFACIILALGTWLGWRNRALMDYYEAGILLLTLAILIGLGWFWQALSRLMCVLTITVGASIYIYQGDLVRNTESFWLKYFLSSQSALLWMGVLVLMATGFAWGALFFAPRSTLPSFDAKHFTHPASGTLGRILSWAAVFMALQGSLVRWYESYLIGAGVGHIPVSNLYEVLVLFVWMTLLLGLYVEKRHQTQGILAFVLLIVAAAVLFLLWYSVSRQGHIIQPLVAPLQSWWMKLHVPANLIAYGAFSLAAATALAWLLKTASARSLWLGLVGSMAVCTLLFLGLAYSLTFNAKQMMALQRAGGLAAVLALLCTLLVSTRGILHTRLPTLAVLDNVMYKSITLGFTFFTLATILGALWAAEAWGAYWSWDPKETWALIVWINYAAWLHVRFIKRMQGAPAAWWALVGLIIVTFAFIGVNLFLGGMHSYGKL